jgi:hypothetical protein
MLGIAVGLGLAKGDDKPIYVPSESDLLRAPYLYGYEETKAQWLYEKLAVENNSQQAQITSIQQQIATLQAELHRKEGIIGANQYITRQLL